MGAARGIAGSSRPEQLGCFLCEEDEVDWFVRMNNTGGPVDVWVVSEIAEDSLVYSAEGYGYVSSPVPADRLRLIRVDIEPVKNDPVKPDAEQIAGSAKAVFRTGRMPDPR